MRTAILALALATVGCSSTAPRATSPGSSNVVAERFSAAPSTILVTNAATIQLLAKAYLSVSPPLPQPLGGMLVLGSVGPSASDCIAIPDTVLVFVTNVTTGHRDTMVWTSARGLAVSALDSATVTERAQSQSFVPSAAAGWSITFPSSSSPSQVSELTAAPAARCVP